MWARAEGINQSWAKRAGGTAATSEDFFVRNRGITYHTVRQAAACFQMYSPGEGGRGGEMIRQRSVNVKVFPRRPPDPDVCVVEELHCWVPTWT
jgi:hypothetical protein